MPARLLDSAAEANRTTLEATLAALRPQIIEYGRLVAETLSSGKKLLACGNGGSAAEAQHLVAEMVGRFHTDRRPLAAMALTTDTSVLTAVGNDYGFRDVFARQVRALAGPGDALLLISTSGNSESILAAATCGREIVSVVSFRDACSARRSGSRASSSS